MKKIKINPKILKNFFDLSVIQACSTCKRFNVKSKCPPLIPDIYYYKKLLPSYNKGVIILMKFPIENHLNWKEIGNKSSLVMHKYLLKYRQILINNGKIFNIALTGGSCKLCEKCSIPCRFPEKSLVAIEGTGINVVKLMKKFNINIKFPVDKQEYFYRIGMVLFND